MNGVEKLIPVSTLEECKAFQPQGFLTAAERNGEKVEGFDFGNFWRYPKHFLLAISFLFVYYV